MVAPATAESLVSAQTSDQLASVGVARRDDLDSRRVREPVGVVVVVDLGERDDLVADDDRDVMPTLVPSADAGRVLRDPGKCSASLAGEVDGHEGIAGASVSRAPD